MKNCLLILPPVVTILALAGPGNGAAQKKSPFPRERATLTLRGKVLYEAKKPPRRRRLRMEGDTFCETVHKEKVYLETLIVNRKMEVKNVFVYVKSGVRQWTFAPPPRPVVMDQVGCIFVPHVLGIMVGQPLHVRNSDSTSHNVHFLGRRNREWNKTHARGHVLEASFRRREIMARIKCDIHSWMGAYVGILPHPFFAVTRDDGSFDLGRLPPGEYTVAAWHEKLGTLTQKVVLQAGEEPRPLVFKYAPRKKGRS